MVFFVLGGIVISLIFLRANLSFLGIYRRILGHICNEIWVMLWDTTTDFGVARNNWNSLGLGRLYYIFICHSWHVSHPELINIKLTLVVFSDSVFVQFDGCLVETIPYSLQPDCASLHRPQATSSASRIPPQVDMFRAG
jgi:hypothetical protein